VLNDKTVNPKSIARKHVIERSNSGLYSLMGGKWTTYRKMGEDLVNEISKESEKKDGKKFNESKSWGLRLVGSCSEH
jgi:glycerol-3-phosphate dehydrogenase